MSPESVAKTFNLIINLVNLHTYIKVRQKPVRVSVVRVPMTSLVNASLLLEVKYFDMYVTNSIPHLFNSNISHHYVQCVILACTCNCTHSSKELSIGISCQLMNLA